MPRLPRHPLPAFLLAAAALLLLLPAPARAQATIGEPIEVEEEVPADAPPKAKNEPAVKAPAPKADVPEVPAAGDAAKAPEADVPAAAAGTSSRVLIPADDEASIGDHWRRRVEHLQSRDEKRADEQDREIERIRDELRLDNLFTVATALVREADALTRADKAVEAVKRCETAVRVAPGFYLAHLCLARAHLAAEPVLGAPKAFGRAMDALGVALQDARSRRNAIADELLVVLFALVFAAGALVVIVIARYAGLFAHDFHHVFPRGAARWQTLLLALIVVALPVFLGVGLLGTVVLCAAAVGIFLTRAEAIAMGCAFAILGGAQLLMGPVVQAGAFGLVANDVYLLERGDAPRASVVRLQARVDGGLGDYTTAFALGRFYKRVARLEEAEAAYGAALKFQRTAEVLNNLGNVRFLAGDAAGAQKYYRDANAVNPSVAAPLYNISKMYFREGKLDQGQQAQKAAVEIGGEQVAARLGVNDDVRANQYVIDAVLTDEQILAVADRESLAVHSLGGRVVTLLIGRTSHLFAALLSIAAGLLVGLLQLAHVRVRPSSRCDKCGRPVCVRCDPELGGPGAMCGQCISVFVRRTGVDAPDRIRKEIEVRHFRRRQRFLVRALGLLVGGGGHVLSGRVVGGALFLLLFCLPAAHVVFWDGLLPPPVVAHLSASMLRVVIYAALLIATYVLSVRHLLRHEELD